MKQGQAKFILSPFYDLPNTTDILEFDSNEAASEDVLSLKDKNSFFLRQVIKDRLYLINPTIQYFLSLFVEPVTSKEVIEAIAQKANCLPDDIRPVIDKFAKDMLKRQILVPADKAEEMLSFKNKMETKLPLLQIGQDFHGYIIQGELAMRGKLELYTAIEKSSKEECVIKALYLPQELSAKRKAKVTKEFYQEFQLMGELKGHENVCELKEIIIDKYIPAAAMEKIEGRSLRGWLRDRDVIPDISDRLKVLVQVFAAIAWVQKQGIFHGDIHASNFLVHDNHVKLIDFDLANHATPEKNEIMRKGGVYEYIAPECLNKNSFSWLKQKANYQSEVYQLGVIMYFLLYNDFPFKAVTWQGLAEKILNTRPSLKPTTENEKPIPEEIRRICARCLHKNPKRRYQSAITLHRQMASTMKAIANQTIASR